MGVWGDESTPPLSRPGRESRRGAGAERIGALRVCEQPKRKRVRRGRMQGRGRVAGLVSATRPMTPQTAPDHARPVRPHPHRFPETCAEPTAEDRHASEIRAYSTVPAHLPGADHPGTAGSPPPPGSAGGKARPATRYRGVGVWVCRGKRREITLRNPAGTGGNAGGGAGAGRMGSPGAQRRAVRGSTHRPAARPICSRPHGACRSCARAPGVRRCAEGAPGAAFNKRRRERRYCSRPQPPAGFCRQIPPR